MVANLYEPNEHVRYEIMMLIETNNELEKNTLGYDSQYQFNKTHECFWLHTKNLLVYFEVDSDEVSDIFQKIDSQILSLVIINRSKPNDSNRLVAETRRKVMEMLKPHILEYQRFDPNLQTNTVFLQLIPGGYNTK